jgi:hypothetical protein
MEPVEVCCDDCEELGLEMAVGDGFVLFTLKRFHFLIICSSSAYIVHFVLRYHWSNHEFVHYPQLMGMKTMALE